MSLRKSARLAKRQEEEEDDYADKLRSGKEHTVEASSCVLAKKPSARSPSPIEIDFSTANPQITCPLFTIIPPEIRNEIFSLMLQDYTDEENLYPQQSFYSRPGVEGPRRVDVALLRTCKAVYAETRGLPAQQLEEIMVWFRSKQRAPEDVIHVDAERDIYVLPSTHKLLAKYKQNPATKNKLSNLASRPAPLTNSLHICSQMYAITPGLQSLSRLPYLHPSTVVLTIRYTDWWWWEDNNAIFPIDETPFFDMQGAVLPASVQRMVVEFESIEGKRRELDGVIREMFVGRRERWVWRRMDGVRLVLRGEGPVVSGGMEEEDGGTNENRGVVDGVKEWTWMGPTTYQNGKDTSKTYSHHGKGESMGMVVKVLEWGVEDAVEG